MNCPLCGADSRVQETRVAPYGLRRRRQCALQACRHRFTTTEILTPVSTVDELTDLIEAVTNKRRAKVIK